MKKLSKKEEWTIVSILTIVLMILTPFIHHIVRMGQKVYGGECLLWIFPLLFYGLYQSIREVKRWK